MWPAGASAATRGLALRRPDAGPKSTVERRLPLTGELDRRRTHRPAAAAAAAAGGSAAPAGRGPGQAGGAAAQLAGRYGQGDADGSGKRSAGDRAIGDREAQGPAGRRGARRGVPAAGRRLRGDIRRQHRAAHQGQHPHAAADGGGADLRRQHAGGQAGPHRRPVRQTAVGRYRRARPEVLPRRHDQRFRGRRRCPRARRVAAGAGLRQRQRRDEPGAGADLVGPGVPAPGARLEPRVRPDVTGGCPL